LTQTALSKAKMPVLESAITGLASANSIKPAAATTAHITRVAILSGAKRASMFNFIPFAGSRDGLQRLIMRNAP
jgi:hypothetical protein